MNMDNKKKEDEYMLINVQSLSESLAETTWKESVQGCSEDELYEMVLEKDNEGKDVLTKQIHSYWSNVYWNLQRCYLKYIKTFRKNDTTDQAPGDHQGVHTEPDRSDVNIPEGDTRDNPEQGDM